MFPENIKVGGINYKVILKSKVKSDTYLPEGHVLMGTQSILEAEINILSKMNRQLRNQTLIHEVMHAVFDECGFDYDDEEEMVNMIGKVLYQVLMDNDFSFLKEEL